MLRSLIVQLCGVRPDTPKSLSDLRPFRDTNRQPGLESLEKALQASMQEFKHVYLVVDALDECSLVNGQREALLKFIGRVHSWNMTNLHVLYTSRPEPDIKTELKPLFQQPATWVIDLQKRREEVNRDISAHIEQKIASSNFSFWSPETKENVKVTLTSKADGMYDPTYQYFKISS